MKLNWKWEESSRDLTSSFGFLQGRNFKLKSFGMQIFDILDWLTDSSNDMNPSSISSVANLIQTIQSDRGLFSRILLETMINEGKWGILAIFKIMV